MDTIGKMSLTNQGGFVCNIQFAYLDGDKEKLAHYKSGDIDLGQTKTVDPADANIADGTLIKMHVFVHGGKDNEYNAWFTYQAGNSATAHFVISGTTLSNKLGLLNEAEA